LSALEREVARLADDLLFERALDVDARDEIPRGHFDALAAAGLYGIEGPRDAGGLDLDVVTRRRIRERLAGGCLSTAFVWAQHHGAVRCVRAAPAPIRDLWLQRLCSGQARAGLALAGLIPAPAPLLRIERRGLGWALDGSSPMVTGWGYLDVLLVAARVHSEPDAVAFALVDTSLPGLRAQPRRLAACNAARTVQLRFDGVKIGDDDVVETLDLPAWAAAGEGVRLNGVLAIGVAERCARLLASDSLHAEIATARDALDAAADGDELAQVRADAALLAMRAASTLVVARGSAAVDMCEHAQRLAREAIFLLAFGQRPAIKEALLRGLA